MKASQDFQTWLAKFRSSGISGYVLLAKPDMTDEQLRELWTEAHRLFNRPARKRKARSKI